MTTFTVSAISRKTATSTFLGTYKNIDDAIKVADSNKTTGYLVHVLECDGILRCAPDCNHESSWVRLMTNDELAVFGDSVYTAR